MSPRASSTASAVGELKAAPRPVPSTQPALHASGRPASVAATAVSSDTLRSRCAKSSVKYTVLRAALKAMASGV